MCIPNKNEGGGHSGQFSVKLFSIVIIPQPWTCPFLLKWNNFCLKKFYLGASRGSLFARENPIYDLGDLRGGEVVSVVYKNNIYQDICKNKKLTNIKFCF